MRYTTTHAPRQWISELRTAIVNGLAIFSSIIFLSVAQLFAADSLFEVIAPNAGQEFATGTPMTVQWVMHNNALPGGGVMIQISPDEGFNWFYISKTPLGNNDTTIYRDSIGTFTWTIADSIKVYGYGFVHLASTTCNVKVSAPYDDAYLPATSNRFSIVQSSHVARSHAGRNGQMRPLNSRMKGDQNIILEAISLNGRARSTVHDLMNGNRDGTASGVYFLRPRNSSEGQTTPWCVEH